MLKRQTILGIAIILGLFGTAAGQECNPKEFTHQDVEKIDFSDVVKHSGYSVLEKSSSKEKSEKYGGSAMIYGVPVSLSYDDAEALSNYMLQKSGFDYGRNTKLSIVRTALSSIGAEMYRDCLSAQSIRVEIPQQAYREDAFQLSVTWSPRIRAPANVDYEVRVSGGTVDGKPVREGKVHQNTAALFSIKKQNGKLLQIDIVVYGQKYPSIAIPPAMPVKHVQFIKRYGTYSPPRITNNGNYCSEQANLVAERGSNAGPDTKVCRLCISRSPNGLLLKGTAELEGNLIDAAYKVLDPVKSDLEMCATFTAVGRGKKGPRTEVQGGRFYVYEAVLQ